MLMFTEPAGLLRYTYQTDILMWYTLLHIYTHMEFPSISITIVVITVVWLFVFFASLFVCLFCHTFSYFSCIASMG